MTKKNMEDKSEVSTNSYLDEFNRQSTLWFYALYNPEAPLVKSKGKISLKNSPRKSFSPSKTGSKSITATIEYNSPASNYTLKEEILKDDEEKRKNAIENVFSSLKSFDDDVKAPKYYPVKIANTQQYSPLRSKKENDKKSVMSKSAISKKDQLQIEKQVEIIQRKKEKEEREKEKEEREKEKLKQRDEKTRQYYLEEKEKYKDGAAVLKQMQIERRKSRKEAQEKENEKHQKKMEQVKKVKKEYQDQLEKYKRDHPFSNEEPSLINRHPFY